MSPYQIAGRNRQQGAVLIIVLVMVGIFMIIVTSLVSSSNINFRIAGNQQYRMEAKAAARNAVEDYISNSANFKLPLLPNDLVYSFDFDGDGVDDISASVAPPVCTKAEVVSIGELVLSNPDDFQCRLDPPKSGIIRSGGPSGNDNSLCARMNWDVGAEVADASTGAAIEMHQGIYMMAIVGTPCPS